MNPEKYAKQKERLKENYHADVKVRARQADYNWRRNYGLSLDRFFEMLAEQKGRCRLCGEPFGQSSSRKPVPDHDHETGEVRGIIHGNCNLGLGMFQDDPIRCRKAADYLESFGRRNDKPKLEMIS